MGLDLWIDNVNTCKYYCKQMHKFVKQAKIGLWILKVKNTSKLYLIGPLICLVQSPCHYVLKNIVKSHQNQQETIKIQK